MIIIDEIGSMPDLTLLISRFERYKMKMLPGVYDAITRFRPHRLRHKLKRNPKRINKRIHRQRRKAILAYESRFREYDLVPWFEVWSSKKLSPGKWLFSKGSK